MWYGERDSQGNSTVTYVVAPRQNMSRWNYHISAEALGHVVNGLAAGWKPVAQVHSHPGSGVEHSRYDDRMVSTRKALSLVFPWYGKLVGSFLEGVGVHEWQEDYWHLLPASLASRRVICTAGDVKTEDFR